MRSSVQTGFQISALAVALVLAVQVSAQQAEQAPSPEATASPQQSSPAEAAPAVPQAPPPPGEEVMRPTEHGLRMTPAMARAMSRAMSTGIGKEGKLTAEQQKQLGDAYARRLMQTARTYEEQGQTFIEYGIESMWQSIGSGRGMRFSPETAREFGGRALPALPAIREFLDGMLADTEPFLSPDANAKFREQMNKARGGLDRFTQKMERWSQGQVKEGEDPFSDLEEPETQPEGAEAKKPRPREVRQAEQVADWQINNEGSTQWTSFLNQVKRHFKFDEQQSAKADTILADYRAKAENIMTPAWKEAMRQNRTKMNLRYQLKDVPTIPWMWRLQHEYDVAVKPIQELGWAFRKDILALLTNEQREAALAEIGSNAVQHGMAVNEKDKAVLGLAGGKWSLWKF